MSVQGVSHTVAPSSSTLTPAAMVKSKLARLYLYHSMVASEMLSRSQRGRLPIRFRPADLMDLEGFLVAGDGAAGKTLLAFG